MSRDASSRFVYWLSRGLFAIWMKLWLRLEVHGSSNVPAEGGCLVAANHASFLDPPMIACAVPHRMVQFLARDTLFRFKPFAWWLHTVGVLPLSRERGDVGALKRSIQILKNGECLGLFPEGTRTTDGELQVAKGGVGFLIAKAGVPVVPVYLDGTFKAHPRHATWVKPVKCRVFIGPAISPETFAALGTDRDVYDKIGRLVMDRIRQLRPDASS
jgi:1-acyl-sn-glycerol-3-phosphate acyltransferase